MLLDGESGWCVSVREGLEAGEGEKAIFSCIQLFGEGQARDDDADDERGQCDVRVC